jgi:excisionase family DNA binding protein
MPTAPPLQSLKQALDTCRRALEEFESALLELEDIITDDKEEAPKRSPSGQNQGLLSLPDVCQELGEERSVVYRRLRRGEIPSLQLGDVLKVRRPDLQEYMKGQQRRHRSPGAENGFAER